MRKVSIWLFFLFHFFIFLIFRVAFLFIFNDHAASLTNLASSFSLGLRFDFRLAAILSLTYFIYLQLKKKWSSPAFDWAGTAFFFFISLFVFTCYATDIGYYAYLQTRLDFSIISYFDDLQISYDMMKQTYPVFSITFGVFALAALYTYFIRKKFLLTPLKFGYLYSTIFVFSMIGFMYGNFSRYPLSWSQAYDSPGSFTTALGLNPVLFFIETRQKQLPKITENEKREAAAIISEYQEKYKANEPDKILKLKNPSEKINIVVIIMESLAAHKTSIFNNPANPTPFLDELSKESLLFKQYYVPAEGTARSVYAMMTSVPDSTPAGGTASRNPRVAKRKIPLSFLKDYEKVYFLGGSANWAQIRSIFTSNLDSVKIFEEGSYPDKKVVDVWGISDLDLLQSADENLRKIKTPFFALMQTAGFHRPYSIPEDRHGFLEKTLSSEELEQAGFKSNEEFNSMAFSDWSVKKYFETAKSSPYYKNTIFIIAGDHGLPCLGAQNITEAVRSSEICKFHTPLIVHSELFEKSGVEVEWPLSETDILPSLIHLIQPEYKLDDYGHDIFSSRNSHLPLFMYYTYTEEYGLFLNDNSFVRVNPSQVALHTNLKSNDRLQSKLAHVPPPDAQTQQDAQARQDELAKLANAYFIWNRALLYGTKN